MNGKIYKITNNLNGKIYIGKTLHKTIEERWEEYMHDYKKRNKEKRPLYSAFKKYGVDNFTMELIGEYPLKELSAWEKYWIGYYDSYGNGYNATLGGDGKQLYDYELLVEEYQTGKTVKEVAQLFNCSVDTVSAALKLAGINAHENAIKQCSKQVSAIDEDGNIVATFYSMEEAGRWIETTKKTKGNSHSIAIEIGKVVRGTRKTAYGYRWIKSEK